MAPAEQRSRSATGMRIFPVGREELAADGSGSRAPVRVRDCRRFRDLRTRGSGNQSPTVTYLCDPACLPPGSATNPGNVQVDRRSSASDAVRRSPRRGRVHRGPGP